MCTRLNRSVFAALALAIAGGAWASQDVEVPLTRAQVIAELQAAQAEGTLGAMMGEDGGSSWLMQQPFVSAVRADDVRAVARAAQRSGALMALLGEAASPEVEASGWGFGPLHYAGLHRWRHVGGETASNPRSA